MSRQLLPLRALQAFEAAARHLSFAKAAQELHVTPAAISQQIKLLEDQIDDKLFERGAALRLTPRAAAVLRPLREALDGLDSVSQQLRAGNAQRPLVVSLPPSFASRWLIPHMESFSRKHPDIELHLQATTRMIDFDSEGVDVAVRYGSGRYPGLHVERLRTETVVVVAHPRLAAGLKKPADLLGATLLHNSGLAWDPTFPDWPAWLRSAGVTPPKNLRIRRFNDANMVFEACFAGLGVALLWRTLVDEEIKSGRLVALFPERPLANAYHFVCPAGRLENPAVAAFRRWLIEEAGSERPAVAKARQKR
jgi:LysR family glycine cleavage system transcriptional activator